ncbi:D-apionate lactonase [Pararhizobium sp.]|uniref:D-apionate lactonase n=1 Tax=Pararhizobium sp. TaxID=1977563 RepID=UPI00271BA2E9|nr:hypothetical protein [Pararhizobium sp.]MDO9418423.1 hypothetical protein [Pararhizobium sp.]
MSDGVVDSDEAFRLYGTRTVEIPPRRLRAGRLSADLTNGNLRSITYDGIEVLRAISFLVRDRDWGTYEPVLSGLTTEESSDAFQVRYRATCAGPDGTSLRIDAVIEGTESGLLTFQAEAATETGFETNRCGFCILHPIVGLAGAPVTVEHVDGLVDQTHLPDLIEPWQPFKLMRAITHTVVDGVTAECRMEGDAFEMEDQRNWSDASYKTYVRPLELPWPYQIGAAEPVRQHISLTIRDERGVGVAGGAGREDFVTLTPGSDHGIVPSIGLVVTPEEASDPQAVSRVVAETGVQELLFHFDPGAGHDLAALQSFAAIDLAHRGTSTIEIALPCKRDVSTELTEIAALMRDAGFAPDAAVVSPSVDRQSTPPGSLWPDCPPLDKVYAAARAALPDVRLGGGMLSYFTELNRKRVPAEHLDFVSHCTNPIVHAADDLSVIQTLEALPFITRSVRAIYGDKPYRIGPSTIPMRQNPYGSRTMDNSDYGRIPMANRDGRHNGDFGAAFALGYMASVANAGLDRLTLSAATGPFGLIAGADEPEAAGELRPLGNIVQVLAGFAGQSWVAVASSAPESVLALLMRDGEGDGHLLVANMTAQSQSVDWTGIAGTGYAVLHSLGGTAVMIPGESRFRLGPFSTARLSFRPD